MVLGFGPSGSGSLPLWSWMGSTSPGRLGAQSGGGGGSSRLSTPGQEADSRKAFAQQLCPFLGHDHLFNGFALLLIPSFLHFGTLLS